MVGRTVIVLLSPTIKQYFGKLLLLTASEEGALSPTGLQNSVKGFPFESKFWQGSNTLIFQYLTGIHPEIHRLTQSICGKGLIHFLFLQKHTVCLILLFKPCFKYLK